MNSLKIALKNTTNTRSLSNLVNKDGKHIKQHLLIRSDALNKLDKEDIACLKNEYNLTRVIDLRCENEAYFKPDVKIKGVRYHTISILPNERLGMSKSGDKERDFNDFIESQKASGFASAKEFMVNIYHDLIKDSFSNAAYKKFLNVLLEPTAGATLWHCSAGKDRAGFATILILYILNFDWDLIVSDYLATNNFYASEVAKMLEVFGKDYEEILWCVFGVYPDYIDVIIETINSEYGSFDNYITNVLGFDEEKKAMLRNYYLEG